MKSTTHRRLALCRWVHTPPSEPRLVGQFDAVYQARSPWREVFVFLVFLLVVALAGFSAGFLVGR